MKKTTFVKRKVMGRPRTGTTPLMGFRADPAIRAAIVRWAEKQPDAPTLSEAIRRLVELGQKQNDRAWSCSANRIQGLPNCRRTEIVETAEVVAQGNQHHDRCGVEV